MREKVLDIPYISCLRALARSRKKELWLVGGFLRDAALGREKNTRDFDFVVSDSAREFAARFADKVKAKMIVLDEREKTYRCIVRRGQKCYTYDFSQMRGASLEEDLSLRDFTINAMAFRVNDLPGGRVIDLYQAGRDLRAKKIRLLKENNIIDDPLRILRAFSLSARFGFKIASGTLTVLARRKKGLGLISRERINEELFKLLRCDRSFPAVELMSEKKIIDVFIPAVSAARGVYQGQYHHLDVWKHSLETLRCFERLYLTRLNKDAKISDYLQGELAGNRTIKDIIKLACLMHDLGKPPAKSIKNRKTIFHTHEKIGAQIAAETADFLKLSAKEKDCLKKLVFWHLRPGYLADTKAPSSRAVYRFFRDTNDCGAAVILLSLSDWRATRGPLTRPARRRSHEKIMLWLIDRYFLERAKKPLKPVVNGYDLMKKFRLKPSRLIGSILDEIKEEQSLGQIKTKGQAYALAREIIRKQRLADRVATLSQK